MRPPFRRFHCLSLQINCRYTFAVWSDSQLSLPSEKEMNGKLVVRCCLLAHVVAGLAASPLSPRRVIQPILLAPDVAYLLPGGFQGNVSESFLQTANLTDASIAAQFREAERNPFVAFDQEFIDLLPENATFDLVVTESQPVADEMGIWVWDHNQVWMASAADKQGVSYVSILDLDTYRVYQPNTSIQILNPNGGNYHNGKVYIAGDGNLTVPPCIYEIDPVTLQASVYLDSYFGLRFGGPNDLTWTNSKNGSDYLFFSDDPLSFYYNGGEKPQIPDAVWRFDPVEKTLLPVIDRSSVLVPNGIRVSADGLKLFVTDTPPLTYGASGQASSAIYVFDLDSQEFPVNRRLFGLPSRGIADGIHLDDAGRVWTAEGDGIVVRNAGGKVIGMFNALAILGASQKTASQGPLQNFALAGDKLIILAYENIFMVPLRDVVVTQLT